MPTKYIWTVIHELRAPLTCHSILINLTKDNTLNANKRSAIKILIYLFITRDQK